jgi:hypothetical protein
MGWASSLVKSYIQRELSPMLKKYVALFEKHGDLYFRPKNYRGQRMREAIISHVKKEFDKMSLRVEYVSSDGVFRIIFDEERIIPQHDGFVEREFVFPNELQQKLHRFSNQHTKVDEPILVKWNLYNYVIVDGNRRFDALKMERSLEVRNIHARNLIYKAILLNKNNYNELEKIILIHDYPFAQEIFNPSYDERIIYEKIYNTVCTALPQILKTDDPYRTALYVYIFRQYFPTALLTTYDVQIIRKMIFEKLQTGDPTIDSIISENLEKYYMRFHDEFLILEDLFSKEFVQKIRLWEDF